MSHFDPSPAPRRRPAKADDGAAVLVGCLAALVLVPPLMVFGAVITMLAWNYGVVNIVDAAGGEVGTIGFWTALFANMALGVIGSVFRRSGTSS